MLAEFFFALAIGSGMSCVPYSVIYHANPPPSLRRAV